MTCVFCRVAAGDGSAAVVFEDERTLAFLDARPLFPGHCLLIPREHYETLPDVPPRFIGPLFANAQLLAQAVQEGMAAEGSFVAINNRVSQSVPHLHVHIVPRNRKDGLKGFFWPRHTYESPEQIEAVRQRLQAAIAKVRGERG